MLWYKKSNLGSILFRFISLPSKCRIRYSHGEELINNMTFCIFEKTLMCKMRSSYRKTYTMLYDNIDNQIIPEMQQGVNSLLNHNKNKISLQLITKYVEETLLTSLHFRAEIK